MSFRYVIDSSAWIEYLGGEGSGKIESIIDDEITATSIVGIAEIADKFVREGRDFTQVFRFIRARSIVLPVTILGAVLAARLKNEQRSAHPKFSLVDGIHLASARERKATLVTTDSDFGALQDVLLVDKRK